jgi:hypothetical protein
LQVQQLKLKFSKHKAGAEAKDSKQQMKIAMVAKYTPGGPLQA